MTAQAEVKLKRLNFLISVEVYFTWEWAEARQEGLSLHMILAVLEPNAFSI